MDHLSDADLMKLVRNGNELAFAALVNRYAKDLYKLTFKRTSSNAVSQDMVQEIFISLWKNRDSITIKDSLFPYLYQAVIYEVIDHTLRMDKEIAFKSSLLQQTELVQHAVDRDLELDELQRKIDDTVARMPATMRTVFCLSRYEKLSVREIAARLQLSEQTVKNNISLAMQKLRTQLDPNMMALFAGSCFWLSKYFS
jgi:RNA polymerase sigma-70 factor (family 1)